MHALAAVAEALAASARWRDAALARELDHQAAGESHFAQRLSYGRVIMALSSMACGDVPSAVSLRRSVPAA